MKLSDLQREFSLDAAQAMKLQLFINTIANEAYKWGANDAQPVEHPKEMTAEPSQIDLIIQNAQAECGILR